VTKAGFITLTMVLFPDLSNSGSPSAKPGDSPFAQESLSNPKSIMDFYGCFKGLHAFDSEGIDVQKTLRDEW
jgi:hypothetical protein